MRREVSIQAVLNGRGIWSFAYFDVLRPGTASAQGRAVGDEHTARLLLFLLLQAECRVVNQVPARLIPVKGEGQDDFGGKPSHD